jgi:hypothetical protein
MNRSPPISFNIQHSTFIIGALSRPKAGNRARTGDLNLGKVALYQLSYARVLSAPDGAGDGPQMYPDPLVASTREPGR